MLSKFKERASKIIEPIAGVFARAGFTPNFLTFLGLVFGTVAAFLFFRREQLLAGFVLLICGFFDMIDGAVARVTSRDTKFGGVLDSVTDRYVDFAIFTGIILGGLAEVGILPGMVWGLLALSGSFMVSYVRARAEAAGTGKLDVGIAERGERLLILSIAGLVGHTGYGVAIVAILTHLTVVHRLIVAKMRL